MGEARRRGDFESRKNQAVQNAEWEAAKRKVEQEDREAAERVRPNQTYPKRSRHSMALAVATLIAASSCVISKDLK